MLNPRDVLGLNAREKFTTLNSPQARAICSSKYATKVLLSHEQIPTAEVYGVLGINEDIRDFDWSSLKENFVIKPTNGNAGKGVVAFRRQTPDGQKWVDVVGNHWTKEDITLHCSDILEGLYSTYGRDHNVIIEERIVSHPTLRKYAFKGTPDIRVVVFNHTPIMALMRLPTRESEGRANQSQGAIGVGIDMATGITTYATAHLSELIQYLPGTKKKLNGIKIPFWKKTLTIAVQAADAAGIVYAGVDIFIHETKGPMIAELNANPGLSIQISNQAGLRRRLERVQGLNVLNADHGVRIAQALFAESFADKIKAEEGLTIVKPKEDIEVLGENKRKVQRQALINTGRFRSAISAKLAEDLGLIDLDDLLWFQQESEEGKVPVVEVSFILKDKKRKTAMVVSKRLNKGGHQVELGRKDLAGFLVQTEE